MRLIKDTALKEKLDALIASHTLAPTQNAKKIIYKAIDDTPTIDAVPVTRAHWIKLHALTSWRIFFPWQCSTCGDTAFLDSKYCPNCGTIMDEPPEKEEH